jgi:hypothetical protein
VNAAAQSLVAHAAAAAAGNSGADTDDQANVAAADGVAPVDNDTIEWAPDQECASSEEEEEEEEEQDEG